MERQEIRYVTITELREGTRIHSFDLFHEKYQSMDERIVDWIKHNFKGASCIIERDDRKLGMPISKIEIGDTLLRVFKFPSNLSKLTIVNEKLIDALKSRGFLGFKVSTMARSPKQDKRQEDIHRTEAFFKEIEDSEQIKDDATAAIESLMDQTRDGETNILELMKYIDIITQESSPEALSVIAALKMRDKTYAHSLDVGVIYQTVYARLVEKRGIESRFKDAHEALMGAFMHDFGKSKISKDIIDSTERFDPDGEEIRLIRSHPTLGAELLSKMRMPDYIVNMAHFHHVKFDTTLASSYPDIKSYDALSFEDKLLNIVDMYQALVGRRAYKNSWAPPAAMSYMDQMSGVELDLDVWDEFAAIMGRFPVGSLVLLSNGYQAFVSDVNTDHPEQPQVVVVMDDKGEKQTKNEFLDLAINKDIKIKKGLDHFEVFGEQSLEVFLDMSIV